MHGQAIFVTTNRVENTNGQHHHYHHDRENKVKSFRFILLAGKDPRTTHEG